MKKCAKNCINNNKNCSEKECRAWINYKKDLNCTIITIANNNEEPLTLREVAERIGVSFVRVKQIEDKIFDKMKKNLYNLGQ